MDDDITEEERREAMEAAYEAVEDAMAAAHQRALEEIEGARKAPPEGAKGELALAHRAVTTALVQLRDARAVLAGA